jgi:hypothetical protein
MNGGMATLPEDAGAAAERIGELGGQVVAGPFDD